MAQELLEIIVSDDTTNLEPKLEKYLSGAQDGTLLGNNPLVVACEHSKENCAREIIRLQPQFAWGKNQQNGYSPMHFSCENGLITMVKELTKVDPELCRLKDNHSRTPLHVAVMKGNEEAIRVIVTACPESLKMLTCIRETALHLALNHNQCGSFEVLMEEIQKHKQEDLLNWKDHEGNTVFHISTSKKQVQILELLVHPTNGPLVEVNARNRQGFTALDLHYQNYSDRVDRDISRLLHKAGAKQGYVLYSYGGQPILEPPPKFTEMMVESISWVTKSILLAVLIFIAGAAYACLFNLPNIYHLEDHVKFTMLSVDDLTSAYQRLPNVFYFMVFNTVTFTGSMIMILANTWSLVSKWSLCFRAVPLFITGTMSMSYALVAMQIMPKFWVAIGTYKISSFWLMWLYNLSLMFSIVMVWLMVKKIGSIFSKPRA
ncbi:ankyrin repeat-containing protein At2g01680-like [Actinidia eriantha]|uniref:ankyrin repeat-containing protein At2g01680-like n=1 Tax=Actinidia eriantha TaxID=165200 RepID=UPI0025868928|nr:ankyrin repeat-containing protein At2g01680-like [Actinidia eriantha]